ncbi:MAG: M23 family metallopeptidase [Spirochaetes bacterium]|jgi:murein DD-endopeptidase MepM/ murein hydrolase activator NlpD|nr:M23 family metallopeptidase [Spirochaetota bacterium]
MKRITAAAIIVLTACALYAGPAEYCSEDAVCMIMEQDGGRVRVAFRNRLPVENMVTTVTFTVKPRLENLKSPQRFPLTKVVRGPEPVEIAEFTVVDPSKSWNANIYFNWQSGEPCAGKGKEIACRLPFEKGKKFRVGQGFNGKITHFGDTAYAVDFLMPVGTPIHAARDGVVLFTEHRQEEGRFEPSYRNRANYVIILHDDGSVGHYYHLVKDGVRVAVGRRVKAGDLIGLSGNSGYSNVPHLHFEVTRPADGFRKRAIPFVFVTDYGERTVPEEGGVYSDNGLAVKKTAPVSEGDIVLCGSIKDLKPVDAGGVFSLDDAVYVYVPIDIPGAYSMKIIVYAPGKNGPAHIGNWKTLKSWWYTSYSLKGRDIGGGPGKWMAEILVDGRPVRTLEFILK